MDLIMEYYVAVLKKYVEFSGRARRKEFWMFTLFNGIVMIILQSLAKIGSIGIVFFILYVVYLLAVLLPSLGVSVRRLHDIDRSGWWLLIALIPIVGTIVLIVFCCLDGTPGDNRFGANPKG